MKLLLTAFCAAMITSPLAFAGDKCEKKKCDKEKEEATLIVGKECDKKKKCDKDKEEATLLAHCGKCGDCKKKDCEKCKKAKEKKEEGTLMAESKCKKKCDKEKEESTILA